MKPDIPYPRLFEPASIGNVRLKNRVVMLPMGTAYASSTGEVTQRTIDHYVERAKGGAGLITVGNISPDQPNVLNQLVLDSDWALMGQYELAEKVHACGAKIIAQLNHPGGQKYPETYREEKAISSSARPTTFLDQVWPTPKALSIAGIYRVIEKYVRAAARAKQVGYDMVELHGAHGYLINQFISPFMNKRRDRFGGSLENRMRFPRELIQALRETLGPEFPIGFRLSSVEYISGGITLDESPQIARMLQGAGIAYLSASAGVFESAHKMIDLMRDPEGWREYIFEAMKKAVKIPVLAGGSLKHPDYCERLLREGKADFIGLARPLLADPEWPKKAEEGRAEDIRRCISCNECIIGSARRRRGGGARRCAVNAAAGREGEFSEIVPAPIAREVMVIGGGPAGMEAARVAALRGHRVTLYEKDGVLGGQLRIAGKLPSKGKILWLHDYLAAQLKKLGVIVKLGVTVTPAMVEEAKPDAVVVATGAQPILPDLPGVDQGNVIGAWDLLQEKVKVEGQRVMVIGGGLAGCEAAEYLLQGDNRVTIVEQLPSVAADMEPYNRFGLMELFREKGVVVLTRRKALEVTKSGIRVMNEEGGQEELLEADWIIFALGARPVDDLLRALENRLPKLLAAGDCNRPRVILEAVYEGSLAGRQIE